MTFPDKIALRTMTEAEKIEDRRRKAIENAPPLYRGHYERAYAGKSRMAAIKAMCLRCCHNVRAEITHCTVYDCPLREYRPYQSDSEADDE